MSIPILIKENYVTGERTAHVTADLAAQVIGLTDVPPRLAALEKWAAQFPPLGVISEHGNPGSVTGPVTFAAGGSALEARPSSGDDGMAVHSFTREGFEHQRKFIAALRAEIATGVTTARALVAEHDRLTAQVVESAGLPVRLAALEKQVAHLSRTAHTHSCFGSVLTTAGPAQTLEASSPRPEPLRPPTADEEQEQRSFREAMARSAVGQSAVEALIAERGLLAAQVAELSGALEARATEARRQCEWRGQIEAERDRLAAQVVSFVGLNGRNYCATVEAERDKALAELAEARDERDIAQVERDAKARQISDIGNSRETWRTDCLRLSAELAETHASLDLQRKSNERARARYAATHPDEAGKWPDRTDMVAWLMADYDKMAAELTEAKADAERAVAERNGIHIRNYREMVVARAEADALAGLLLRAPKVSRKADGFWLIVPNLLASLDEPRGDIGYRALMDAVEAQKTIDGALAKRASGALVQPVVGHVLGAE